MDKNIKQWGGGELPNYKPMAMYNVLLVQLIPLWLPNLLWFKE